MKGFSDHSCAVHGRPGATSLPEVAAELAETPAPSKPAGIRERGVAWVSLPVLVLAMSTTGCLITDVPQFQAPKHTAPFLLEYGAQPPVGTVIEVASPMLPTLDFSAYVISQDDAAGSNGAFERVSSKLYIDYGVAGGPGLPYRYTISGTSLSGGGTLDQTQRRVLASWPTGDYNVNPGCHTVTLIVSHIFDDVPGCPVCGDDFSTLTWQVLRCDESMGNCGSLPLTGSGQCPAMMTGCAAVQAERDGGASCPEAVDGGAP